MEPVAVGEYRQRVFEGSEAPASGAPRRPEPAPDSTPTRVGVAAKTITTCCAPGRTDALGTLA